MDIKETARRALQFVDEGRAAAAIAVDKLDTADLRTSTLQHELDHALGTIENGRQLLHAVMLVVSAQHEASKLPSERSASKHE